MSVWCEIWGGELKYSILEPKLHMHASIHLNIDYVHMQSNVPGAVGDKGMSQNAVLILAFWKPLLSLLNTIKHDVQLPCLLFLWLSPPFPFFVFLSLSLLWPVFHNISFIVLKNVWRNNQKKKWHAQWNSNLKTNNMPVSISKSSCSCMVSCK